MSEQYLEFMVYELDDSGERIQLDITEEEFREDNGTSLLHPEQVAVIVKEGLRRIFIWKGSKSPVRKRFISSRVANELQKELVQEAAFHRCKIVSVDQGDEPREFLNAFNFESMEVKERMADMRYVRNIDKDTTRPKGKVVEDTAGEDEEEEEEYYSPALEELKRKGQDISAASEISKPSKSSSSGTSSSYSSKPSRSAPKRTRTSSSYRKSKRLNVEEIIEKIIGNEPPENYKRQNLIVQKQLFGATSKTTNVFGEDLEEIEWEKVLKLPEGVHILKNYIFRIYCKPKRGRVIGIEILKAKEDSEKVPKIEKAQIDISEIDGKVEERILEIDPPENYFRQNLIVGQKLYGYISKKVEVLGEEQESEEWTLVKSIPKKIIMLKDHMFRIYFNKKKKQIDAVEILQKGSRKGKILEEKEEKKEKEEVEGNKENGEDINNEEPENSSENKKGRDLPTIPSNN
jgi:hypothetical protein